MAHAPSSKTNDSAEIAGGIMFMVYVILGLILAVAWVLGLVLKGTVWLIARSSKGHAYRERTRDGDILVTEGLKEEVAKTHQIAPSDRPLTWEDRPGHLRGAAEILAWHRVNGVPMPSYNEMAGRTDEDILERAGSRAKAGAQAYAQRLLDEAEAVGA